MGEKDSMQIKYLNKYKKLDKRLRLYKIMLKNRLTVIWCDGGSAGAFFSRVVCKNEGVQGVPKNLSFSSKINGSF